MVATRRVDLEAGLAALDARTQRAVRVEDDPVGLVRVYRKPEDREIAALPAALLAFGGVQVIRRSVARVLEVLGPSPAEAVRTLSRVELERALRGFAHRIYTGRDVARLLANAGSLVRAHGSLRAYVEGRLASGVPFSEACADLADALRGPRPSRSLAHLVPDMRKGSAAKRLHLYLRWMVRPDDGVDLGVWPLPRAELTIPVDTHILRIGRLLGLTQRRTADARTAAEITASLRAIDPDDPVRFDFPLCHHGISGACPTAPRTESCVACPLVSACSEGRRRLGEVRRGGTARSALPRRAGRRAP